MESAGGELSRLKLFRGCPREVDHGELGGGPWAKLGVLGLSTFLVTV